jgi:hypothetical protein
MIEINLLPEEMRKKESLKISLPDIPIKKTLLAAGAVLLSMQLLLMLGTLYVKIDLAGMTRQVSQLRKDNHEVLRQKAEVEGMQNRMKEVQGLTSRKFFWSAVLSAITNSMTKGVWLTEIKVVEEAAPKPAKTAPAKSSKKEKGEKAKAEKGKDKSKDKDKDKEKEKPAARDKILVLEGAAIGAGQETAFIGKFLKELKGQPLLSELFSDIKASNINQRRFGEYEVYGFTISCRFKKEKTP